MTYSTQPIRGNDPDIRQENDVCIIRAKPQCGTVNISCEKVHNGTAPAGFWWKIKVKHIVKK